MQPKTQRFVAFVSAKQPYRPQLDNATPYVLTYRQLDADTTDFDIIELDKYLQEQKATYGLLEEFIS
jgi:hypothetical protein